MKYDCSVWKKNAVKKETNSKLKQSSNGCIKTSGTEKEFNKLGYCEPQIEHLDNTENKTKIYEIKENISREIA